MSRFKWNDRITRVIYSFALYLCIWPWKSGEGEQINGFAESLDIIDERAARRGASCRDVRPRKLLSGSFSLFVTRNYYP